MESAREKLRQERFSKAQSAPISPVKTHHHPAAATAPAATLVLPEAAGIRLSPVSPFKKAPPVVNTPLAGCLLVLFLSFFAVSVWWLIEQQRQISPLTANELFAQVKSGLDAGRLDEAITKLESLQRLARTGLTNEQQQVFNQALFKRAQAASANEQWSAAAADFLRITPEFAKYRQVRQAIKFALEQLQASTTETRTKLMVGAVSKPVVAPVVLKVQTSTPEKKPNQDALYLPVAKTERPAEHPPQRQESIVITTVRGNYNDDDVARYHKMLADYFIPEHQATNSEPPTFKEWLDKGKPDF